MPWSPVAELRKPRAQVDAPGHQTQRSRTRFGKAHVKRAAGKLRVSERGVKSVNRGLGDEAVSMKKEKSVIAGD